MKRWLFCLVLGMCLPLAAWPAGVELTAQERAYVASNPVVTMCVDPDWEPFERINAQGQHEGIAADLVQLVAQRVGLRIELLPVVAWEQSLAASKAGRCQIMSFLNDTPQRREWLDFTLPIFSDPNVIITREEHPYIADLRVVADERMALPRGTMVAERVRRDFPNLEVVDTDSEDESVRRVSEREADMTVRSLIVAAHAIKKQGLFNLKIAGQIPEYTNQLRIGVRHGQPELLRILNKGVRSISLQERESISNRHAAIEVRSTMNPRLVWGLALGAVLLLLGILFWGRKLRAVDMQRVRLAEQRVKEELWARQEQSRLVAMLSHEVRTPLSMIDGAVQSLGMMLPSEDEQVRLRLQRIRLGVQRIVGLTEQFLTKDRLEDTTLKLRPQPLRLHALMMEIAHQMEAEQRFRFTVRGSDDVRADPDLMQVALRNLMKNAVLYSTPDSRIDVVLEGDARLVVLHIRNQGLEGILEVEPALLFERYTRGRNHGGRPGSGLGLYLVKRVVELHHGEVRLATSDGSMVEFTLTMPRDAGQKYTG